MSPHLLLASTALHPLLLAATKSSSKTTSSSPFGSIIFFVLIIGAAYFLLLRPQRQRARRQQQEQQGVEIGDEVMLTSGIIGRVTWFEADRARLEIAPDVEVEVLRAAISKRVPRPLADDDIAAHDDEAAPTASSGARGVPAVPMVAGLNGHEDDEDEEDYEGYEEDDEPLTAEDADEADQDEEDGEEDGAAAPTETTTGSGSRRASARGRRAARSIGSTQPKGDEGGS